MNGWLRERFAISTWIYPESENSGAIVTRMPDNIEARENHLPRSSRRSEPGRSS